MALFIYKEIGLSNNSKWTVAEAIINIHDDIFAKAKKQALLKSKYTMNASQSGKNRSVEEKYQKQLMGSLAEIYCQIYLEEILARNNIESRWSVIRYDDIRTDGFKSPANEFDIRIQKSQSDKMFSVESRSSITHDRAFINGLEVFDIIGPYSSVAKSGEKMNDIYLRPLYEYTNWKTQKYSPLNFENYLLNSWVKLFIVAAATKEEMINKGFDKSMGQYLTKYRVVKILDADDALQFQDTLMALLNKV